MSMQSQRANIPRNIGLRTMRLEHIDDLFWNDEQERRGREYQDCRRLVNACLIKMDRLVDEMHKGIDPEGMLAIGLNDYRRWSYYHQYPQFVEDESNEF